MDNKQDIFEGLCIVRMADVECFSLYYCGSDYPGLETDTPVVDPQSRVILFRDLFKIEKAYHFAKPELRVAKAIPSSPSVTYSAADVLERLRDNLDDPEDVILDSLNLIGDYVDAIPVEPPGALLNACIEMRCSIFERRTQQLSQETVDATINFVYWSLGAILANSVIVDW